MGGLKGVLPLLLLEPIMAGFATCRVFSSNWTNNKNYGPFSAGYDYKEAPGYAEKDALEADADANSLMHEPSGCQLESFAHAQLNRSFVLSADRPFIIRGATDGWLALEKWDAATLAQEHGAAVFLVGRDSEETLGDILSRKGEYHTGQMNHEHDCYSDGMARSTCPRCAGVAKHFERKYSPFLAASEADYHIPEYLKPLRALQMGIGVGVATGVRPEEHPSAWWANIKGRKRWVLHPPESTSPVDLFSEAPRSCAVPRRYKTTLSCDQEEGDVMWVPSGWFHETCTLEEYSIGLGGVTFKGADWPQSSPAQPCPAYLKNNETGFHTIVGSAPSAGTVTREYRLAEMAYCRTHHCPSLPTRPPTVVEPRASS